jgi:hypothetical protein
MIRGREDNNIIGMTKEQIKEKRRERYLTTGT